MSPPKRCKSGMEAWDTYAPGALCPACKKPRTANGHDPCIADLPGVLFACCGHGCRPGYLYFENGVRIGMKTIDIASYDPAKCDTEAYFYIAMGDYA